MEAKRTLVKSPPELWAELSDIASLARHLGEFGEIRITRTEPESVVEWEGERASGSVRIEPSGWGTTVTLTALPVVVDPPPEPPAPPPEPPPPTARRGFFARLFSRRKAAPPPPPPPVPVATPGPLPAIGAARGQEILTGTLDALGSAHHRPFTR
jgi:hypothetical protein